MNNYKLLPALLSIIKTKNLTLSAIELNVTQSAMSKTLKNIRDTFNDPILIKQGNHFILSKRGEKLKHELPPLLQSLDHLYLPSELYIPDCSRKFSIGSSDYVAQFVLPNICSEMKEQAPHTSIEYLLWQQSWLTQLSDHSVDLISTIADDVPENLYGKVMAEDTHVIVMRENHPLAQSTISVTDYLAEDHIIISGGGDKDSPIDHSLSRMNAKRKVFAKVPFFQAAMELVVKSDSILTTPLHIAANYSHHYAIKVKPLPINMAPHKYYILWHAKHHHDQEHKWFRELCFIKCQNHLKETINLGMKLLHENK